MLMIKHLTLKVALPVLFLIIVGGLIPNLLTEASDTKVLLGLILSFAWVGTAIVFGIKFQKILSDIKKIVTQEEQNKTNVK